MPQTTEAACLLQAGSAYAQRLGFRTKSGGDIFVGIKAGGVSIYFGDAPIYHFDFEGRWQRAFVDGIHYLKGLDASVRAIARERENGSMVLRRRVLSFAEATDLDALIRGVALDLIVSIESGEVESVPPPLATQTLGREELRSFLDDVSTWNAPAWFAHRERYLGTYGPWPFLPPDALSAVVLQATLGQRPGSAFGPGGKAEVYLRSATEFEQHARVVSNLLGRRIAQNRGLFLGNTEVLRLPVDDLLARLEIAGRYFPVGSTQVLIEDFATPGPDQAGWASLREAGLSRVTLGLVAGGPALRASLGQTGDNATLTEIVGRLQGGRIPLGVVLLVGSGGRGGSEADREASLNLVKSWNLSAEDLVTLVDARTLIDPVQPLSDAETLEATTAIKRGLTVGRTSKSARVVAYNPDKQWS